MKIAAVLFLVGCTNVTSGPDRPELEHDARFVGLWAVEQPNHALYEVTYYDFGSDGSLRTVGSDPADCSGHLSRHCVTGSVANCKPVGGEPCEGTVTCVFGDEWFSRSSGTLVIVGSCSDDVPREVVLELAADPSANSEWGGAGGTLVSVGADPNWSHDNWDWVFRKCRGGTTPSTCTP